MALRDVVARCFFDGASNDHNEAFQDDIASTIVDRRHIGTHGGLAAHFIAISLMAASFQHAIGIPACRLSSCRK